MLENANLNLHELRLMMGKNLLSQKFLVEFLYSNCSLKSTLHLFYTYSIKIFAVARVIQVLLKISRLRWKIPWFRFCLVQRRGRLSTMQGKARWVRDFGQKGTRGFKSFITQKLRRVCEKF